MDDNTLKLMMALFYLIFFMGIIAVFLKMVALIFKIVFSYKEDDFGTEKKYKAIEPK